jgi:hypothetical protein
MVEELFALDEVYWPVISGNPEVDPNGVLGNCNYLGPRLNRQEPRASALGHELILTPMPGLACANSETPAAEPPTLRRSSS